MRLYLWTKYFFCSICQHFLPLAVSARVPASGYLWDGGQERRDETWPCFIPPVLLFPGGLGLVCDLVSHMIETHLILLDEYLPAVKGETAGGRREEKMKDGSVKEREEYLKTPFADLDFG